ncbi:MAG TPA: 50S ribosomal protein L28 [Anaerolineae bacterium]|nr:50S ribosomal protein L28 [Anaerolineae bacterium]MCB9076177.1 50S ribosomal protein L28 [Anaerolineaceae bacterium]MCB9098095.1 50S ribosomal protein L28 [Anaerolineales bacterium]MCB9107566.1 50S ribosomal protein L28 [Anaerolineales bacterium]HRV91638.1 50S ribosomal protein L28 [Anaerolineae bacterium]
MSRKCQISGKGPLTGNNVPFSQKKTRRRWLPNLQKRKIYVPELGRSIRLKVSTRALRTIDKKGLVAYLSDEGLSLKDIT